MLSLDLLKNGIVSSVINFGQPRTGDLAFSNFLKTKPEIVTWRVVHNRDNVPHWPFSGDKLNYYHVCTEVFEDADGDLKVCDSSCEDPTCGDQYSAREQRPSDHMTYLGLYLDCSSV